MRFVEVLKGVKLVTQSGNPTVSGLEYDSRRIRPGDVFVALRGQSTDGNRFIDRAIGSGSVAVVTDSAAEPLRDGVAWAQVESARQALARLSANFYGSPGDALAITGITGTNGKSTTAFLVESILRVAGRTSALIGTIEYHVAGETLPAPHTTPESLELNRIFRQALERGATEVVMEVSSHALAQQRVEGMHFDVAVFTNLTRDHLDYHRTMDEYFRAKQSLFTSGEAAPPRVAVLNLDDASGKRLVALSREQHSEVLTYGLEGGDFRAAKLESRADGTHFELVTPQQPIAIFSPLIGRMNVYNLLAAAAAAWGRGLQPGEIARGLAAQARVPGRFERIEGSQPFTVIVDYAHTDDALRNLTQLAREFVRAGGGRVLTLFGCGGDRDRNKRPLMGEAAGRSSDLVVLTSDNPRSEDPLAIMNDAAVGLQRSGAKYRMEPDRRAAIRLILAQAEPGDIVLVAGKGHERLQVGASGAIAFDDREVARELLRAAGYECPGGAGENRTDG
jgi:UDP-N-acetylmuramoyl-L-alanyl-D-glutamate--2,6-diaminopimelate ligase